MQPTRTDRPSDSQEPGLTKVDIWLVEDNDLYRSTIAALIESEPDLRCPIAAPNFEEALAALEQGKVPDIILMDIELPGINGIEGARRVKAISPTSRVIMLTVHEERENIFEAICAGASGYLLKPSPADEIVAAIRQVGAGAAPINAYIASKMLDIFAQLAPARGDYGLTPRETEVLQRMVDGLTMQRIADKLVVSYHTVDTHIRNIYDKLHVHSRSGAVAKALKERLV